MKTLKNSYIEAYLIAACGLCDEWILEDDDELNELVDQLSAEFSSDSVSAELYIIPHEHSVDAPECCCAQYLTDHRPYAVWHRGKRVR